MLNRRRDRKSDGIVKSSRCRVAAAILAVVVVIGRAAARHYDVTSDVMRDVIAAAALLLLAARWRFVVLDRLLRLFLVSPFHAAILEPNFYLHMFSAAVTQTIG